TSLYVLSLHAALPSSLSCYNLRLPGDLPSPLALGEQSRYVVQRFPFQTVDAPVAHGLCSQFFIKCNGRFVPIQAGPFHPAAAPRSEEHTSELQSHFDN